MTVPVSFPSRAMRTLFALCVAGLAACTTSTGGTPTVLTPTEGPSSAAVASSATAPAGAATDLSSEPASTSPDASPAGTPIPTAIDPCKLAPADELSKLRGLHRRPG